jgi:hypothetical protein
MLHREADRFVTDRFVCFPNSLVERPTSFPPHVREWATIALGRMIVAQPPSEWKNRIHEFSSLLVGLIRFWQGEKSERLHADTGAMLRRALKAFPKMKTVFSPEGDVLLEPIREAVAAAEAKSAVAREVVRQLDEWLARRDHEGARRDEAEGTRAEVL